jgi:hypothetical protein
MSFAPSPTTHEEREGTAHTHLPDAQRSSPTVSFESADQATVEGLVAAGAASRPCRNSPGDMAHVRLR